MPARQPDRHILSLSVFPCLSLFLSWPGKTWGNWCNHPTLLSDTSWPSAQLLRKKRARSGPTWAYKKCICYPVVQFIELSVGRAVTGGGIDYDFWFGLFWGVCGGIVGRKEWTKQWSPRIVFLNTYNEPYQRITIMSSSQCHGSERWAQITILTVLLFPFCFWACSKCKSCCILVDVMRLYYKHV